MITQDKFINEVSDKKNRLHRIYVKCLKLIIKLIPTDFRRYSTSKLRLPYTFITICNKSSFEMVKASLYSLYKNAKYIPENITIISDGSWDIKDGITYFKAQGLEIQAIDWKICAEYFKESFPSLNIWASKQIWGKKMAAILYFSEKGPTLFADPDILWYKTPIERKDIDILKFKTTIDNSHNYDTQCIEDLGLNELYDLPPINCGVVYINMRINNLSEETKSIIDYQSKKPGAFAEQTVFANINKSMKSTWDMNEITSEIYDLLTPFWRPTIHYKNMIARHYLWRLKWIYWKDYLNIITH